MKENTNISLKQIAERLKLHPNTVRQKIKQLKQKGVIKGCGVEIDYHKLGYELEVFIFMRAKRTGSAVDGGINDLTQIKEIESLQVTTGIWDLVAIARVKNQKHLLEVLGKISSKSVIVKTVTSIVLTTYKSREEFNPFNFRM
jgi:Lrp/AsnC family transcriptional regulator for asnA, asnC and gidA